MNQLKIAVIGAGSSYTPELIEGLIARRATLPVNRLCLMDIDPEKLRIVGGLACRMLKAAGLEEILSLTGDMEEALTGADYVLAQIRVGGMAARILDEKIPLRHGLLGQETTGAGGLMNALRTVPVMVDIARQMERYAPGGWLINFSNPSGIVAEALLNHTCTPMVGLCNNPVNMLADIEKALGTKDFAYQYVGLNHLSWITSVTAGGEEVLPQLLRSAQSSMKNIPDLDYPEALLAAVPAFPCGYLSYYYLREKQLRAALEAKESRGEAVQALERSLMAKYADPELCQKPAELEKRGGALYSTAAISLVNDMVNGAGTSHVVNVVNKGALPFMAENDVVEVKCRVGHGGPVPVPVEGEIPPYIVGMMQGVKQYERLAVSAALAGDRSLALAAMLAHPLIGDFDKASVALDEMLVANREWLPRFFA